MFVNNSGIKLEIDNEIYFFKSSNIWKLSDTILNPPWVKEEITGDTRKYFELNLKWNHSTLKYVG